MAILGRVGCGESVYSKCIIYVFNIENIIFYIKYPNITVFKSENLTSIMNSVKTIYKNIKIYIKIYIYFYNNSGS
jgi:hypothetical protein